jgi:hypothetical protein
VAPTGEVMRSMIDLQLSRLSLLVQYLLAVRQKPSTVAFQQFSRNGRCSKGEG